MIETEKPPLSGFYIAHYGVRGMRWGQRKRRSTKDSENPKLSTRQKVAVGLSLTAATFLAASILTRRGRTTVRQISGRSADPFDKIFGRNNFVDNLPKSFTKTTSTGKAAVGSMADRAEWKRKVSSVMKDMQEANADQDRWMRSLGLGAAVNNR